MLRAYNINTQKIIEALAVGVDASYIKTDGEWLAISTEIENYDDVLKNNNLEDIHCTFIKGHKREYYNSDLGEAIITAVTPHFRIPKAQELGIRYISESQDHKDIKEFFYFHILNNKEFKFIVSNADVNNYPIKYEYTMEELYNLIDFEAIKTSNSSFGVPFEISTTDLYNTRRVDVLLPFKTKHTELGIGLAIEIQLSKQSDELERERTIDRALKGLSVCWINFKHFDTFYDKKKLKTTRPLKLTMENRIYVQTQKSILSSLESKAIYTLQECARRLDEKKEQTLKEIDKARIVTGTICSYCNKGLIGKNKYGTALVCSEGYGKPNYDKNNSSFCKFWVSL
jgi:hypothetical protein